MKRIGSALLAVILAAALCGCGSSSSSASEAEQAPAADESKAVMTAATVDDFDLVSSYFTGSGEEYLGLTLDELNAKTGGCFDASKASENDDFSGRITYGLGELSTMLGGRAALPSAVPVKLILTFGDDGKIKRFTYELESSSADPYEVSAALAACLKENLPESYSAEYDVKQLGKHSARFADSADGHVFTVEHADLDGSGYPIRFFFETYKDKYGM